MQSFESRALNGDRADYRYYKRYEILKPIEAESGPAAALFGKDGGGIQHKLKHSIEYLLANGYIVAIVDQILIV